ncbi:sugar ABC transporter substrate-binding protein [Streptosporangium sp. NPDC000396]|uniref:sugar ABC transporter substrate-binding protein n=1 Tax=Streptosporangium sp. NPDC000396 TaxID=3366185 RepID=UPI0036BA61D8
MSRAVVHRMVGGVAFVATLLGMTACGTIGQEGRGGAVSPGAPDGVVAKGFKIGLLLPERKAARYEKFDRPYITRDIAALCPKCEVVYGNADQDVTRQQRQLDSMLADGVKVIILDAVDSKAIAPSVVKATEQGVKVVAYDRLATGPVDAYTSFDNIQVGKMQGEALLDALKEGGEPGRGPIVMINGSPADPNAGEYKKGAHSVLDGQVIIGREYDIPDWSPQRADVAATGAFDALGPAKVIGVYSANDALAGGIARAMQATGVKKGTPLTGQDAELAAIQRILVGTQTVTIYKPIKPEAGNAAQMAVSLGAGRAVTSTATVNNGTSPSIPAQIIQPVVVTKDNVKDTVVRDGFWTVQEICTAEVRAACEAVGLS